MAQALSKIYVHLIFHIHSNSPVIQERDLERVHCYIGQLVNITTCSVIRVGGVNDHVHSLLRLSRDVAVSHLTQEVKRNSSRWIKTIDPYYQHFEWQVGYAAFSVSHSLVERTTQYIIQQKEHHKKRNFQEEYLKFLRLYDVEYDDRSVLSD